MFRTRFVDKKGCRMGRINVTSSIFAELCAPTTDHVLKTDDSILAEGAIALSVTLSGGALFAS